MTAHVVAIQSWSEITHDVGLNWWIYLSMPIIAAFVGWFTKLIALRMIFRPIDFRGIGPFGWQGVVPRRAGKVGSKTIELLTAELLRPEEILDRFDAREAIAALEGPLSSAVDDIAREIAEQVRPGLWDSLPERARAAVQTQVRKEAPDIVEGLLAEVRSDMPRYIDLQYLAVSTLVRNKLKLERLLKTVTADAMAFVRRSGIYFGFGIGVVQMFAWAIFHNPWIMPAFGFAVGFLSDYIALNMLFRPLYPTKFLGLFTFQGVLHAQREQVTRDYAKILAEDLFSPDNLLEAVLRGPGADKMFALIGTQVQHAIDEQTSSVRPIVTVVVGTKRYRAVKDKVADAVIAHLPDALPEVRDYAASVVDLENTIVTKMADLSPEGYESIMRPVFKDDEPLMIAIGAILGGLVGELQVQIMELVARH